MRFLAQPESWILPDTKVGIEVCELLEGTYNGQCGTNVAGGGLPGRPQVADADGSSQSPLKRADGTRAS